MAPPRVLFNLVLISAAGTVASTASAQTTTATAAAETPVSPPGSGEMAPPKSSIETTPSTPPSTPPNTPPNTPPRTPPRTPARTPASAPSARPEVTAKKVAAGTNGWFVPGLLAQGWFFAERGDATTTTFRLRRAEITVKGEILPERLAYAVMFDPARVLEVKDTAINVANQTPPPDMGAAPEQVTVKQPPAGRATAVLQDFYITFKSCYVDASIGQFKIPVSWEGYNSSGKLLFPERAIVANLFGDKRDLGIRLAKTFPYFGYSAGLFNGAGVNNLDINNGKDAGLRVEAYPIEGLVLAGVVYASIGDRAEQGAKDRYEGDVRFERGPYLVQAEYIRARDVGKDGAATPAQGFYAAFGYKITDDLQAAARIGYFDPDADHDVDPAKVDSAKAGAPGNDELWHFEGAVNYYLEKHEAKLQLSYSRFEFDQKKAANDIIFAAQVFF